MESVPHKTEFCGIEDLVAPFGAGLFSKPGHRARIK
jgi:hypothetical protein